MNKGLTKTILAILLLLPLCANATPIDVNFYSNATIQDGDEYGTVNIYDTPPDQTTVIMTGGQINYLYIYDTAVLNYLAGEIVYLVAHDDSVVDIHSDYDYGFVLEDRSKVSLYNGGSDFQVLIISNNAQLHIYGYDLAFFNGNGGPYLEGRWEDSLQDFRIGVRYAGGVNLQDVIFLHEVPEPSTFLVLGLGYFLIRA